MRAGLAHLRFESIHPFEDGNGRIGRAIAEKALVQGFGQPVLLALGKSILARHRGANNATTGLPTYVRMNGILGDGPSWLGCCWLIRVPPSICRIR